MFRCTNCNSRHIVCVCFIIHIHFAIVTNNVANYSHQWQECIPCNSLYTVENVSVYNYDVDLSAGINCFIILKLYFFCIILNSFDKCEHFCKWTARMVPLGTLAVAIVYILTSCTRFRSWSFYRYRKRFGDLDHCSLMTGEIEKTRNLGFIS
jgi:hypothetical protein